MNLTAHFTLEELEFSSTAVANSIDNAAPDKFLDNARRLAQGLEQVRSLLGFPLHIDSGYRCPELNTLVRGVPTSEHCTFDAADFVCPQFGTPEQIVKLIANSSIQFDQCIQEGTWVHISFSDTPRRQVLTAHFTPAGKTTYTKGA